LIATVKRVTTCSSFDPRMCSEGAYRPELVTTLASVGRKEARLYAVGRREGTRR
jgi:hypothetical protein